MDGVGECYLYSSGAYPYTLSTATVTSEHTGIELIDPTLLTPGATVTARDFTVVVGTTKEMSIPSYSGVTTYFRKPWLTFSSADSTVCAIDTDGIATGVNMGSTTITVKSKITGDTGSCTVHVVGSVIEDITLLYAYGTSNSAYFSTLLAASDGFYQTFGITFSIGMQSSFEMQNVLSGCTKSSDEICDSTCGDVTKCNSIHTCNAGCSTPCENLNTHHRSAVRLLQILPSSVNTPFVVRYVDTPMCTYQYNGENQNTSHYAISGAQLPGTKQIVVYNGTHGVGTTQHELSHTYGTLDNYGTMNCSSNICVMNGYTNKWCSNCYNIIMQNRE